jgi:hypothetical protein
MCHTGGLLCRASMVVQLESNGLEVEIDVYVFRQLRFLRLNIAQQMAA